MRLTPLDPDSPNFTLAEHLAGLLYRYGVSEVLALPVAITIMGGIQFALDSDDPEAAAQEWSTRGLPSRKRKKGT